MAVELEQSERVVLVLSRSPVRSLMRTWLGSEGYDVQVAHAWEVDRLVDEGAAGVVITSGELDGEWGWSSRHDGVLVLALPDPPPD
ncbi:MAG: hypothetical protein AB7V62_02725 [Thermoleophilia bacterium]